VSPKKSPKVDVILCCLDNPMDLLLTLRSILNLPNNTLDLRLICVDSSTTPDVKKVLTSFKHFSNTRYCWMARSGIYEAMNLGISLSRNDSFLWFLNPGDVFNSKSKSAFRNGLMDPQYNFVVFQAESQSKIGKYFPDQNIEINLENILTGKFSISHQAFLISKQSAVRIGMFETRYRICADLLMISKAFLRETGIVLFEPLIVSDEEGVSSRNRYRTIWETYNISLQTDKKNWLKYLNLAVIRSIRLAIHRLKVKFFNRENAGQFSKT